MSEDVDPESPPPDDKVLATLLHRIVRTYVTDRAESRSGIDLDKYRKGDKIEWEALPPKFAEERRKVGASLFWNFDRDAIKHSSNTSRGHCSPANSSFQKRITAPVGLALLNQTDDVKTLTLMALSANS